VEQVEKRCQGFQGCVRLRAHPLTPGLAFPTTVSVNNVVAHFTPLPSDPEVVLKDGDVVKIMLGIQFDGYAVTHAETIHLSSKTDGAAADVIRAAYDAAQLAMRTLKVGNKNWDVTEVVDKAAKDYGCSAVEGMLSCQHEKNVTDGKKRIILNPTPELKREHETVTFDEGEVYGVDVLVVSGADGKVRRSLNALTPGQTRSVSHVRLQARRRQLSTQDEDLPRRLLRDPEESRRFPVHTSCARRREACSHGRARGRCSR
jgi:methionine aminopeptidase